MDLASLFNEFYNEFHETLPIKLDSPVMEVRNEALNNYLIENVRDLFSYALSRFYDLGIKIPIQDLWNGVIANKLISKMPRGGIKDFLLVLFLADGLTLDVTPHSNPLYFWGKVRVYSLRCSSSIEIKALILKKNYFDQIGGCSLDKLEDRLTEIIIDEAAFEDVKWIIE